MSKATKAILQQAERLYNAKAINENALGNSTNMIFEMDTAATPIILRVSEYSEERESHIDFELNWLNYLSENMAEVAKPIHSKHNRFYEIITGGSESYILCGFKKASGKLVDTNNSSEWNEDLFKRLGKIMGTIHRLSKAYEPRPDTVTQHQWNRDIFFQPQFHFNHDDELEQIWNRITGKLHKLPKCSDAYGIIHNDLHQLNFFIDGENITVFDFDDCIYSWYAFDIVLTVTQGVATIPKANEKKRNYFAQKFLSAFLQGYLSCNSLDAFWVDHFDLFFKYRRICSYKFIKHLSEKSPDNPYKEYCGGLRNEILQDKAVVSLDLVKIKSLLK